MGKVDSGLSKEAAQRDELTLLRNIPEFAAATQWLQIFGPTLFPKLPELDVLDIEAELLGTIEPRYCNSIRLQLLYGISSNRTIKEFNMDEHIRHQFRRRRPHENPFGEDDEPRSFHSLSLTDKCKVLNWLCEWQMVNGDKFRSRTMDIVSDELSWRIEPAGTDSNNGVYFVLDDLRLYRRQDKPAPPTTTNSKKRKRNHKRVITDDEDDVSQNGEDSALDKESLIVGWECLCTSYIEWKDFLDNLKPSRNPAERELHRYLSKEVMPTLQEEEDKLQRARERREKERLKEALIYNRKKSSRIQSKEDKRKQLEEEEAEEQRRQDLLREAKLREEREKKTEEQNRESRMQTREQRIRDKEIQKVLEEERILKESQPPEPASNQRLSTPTQVVEATGRAETSSQVENEDGTRASSSIETQSKPDRPDLHANQHKSNELRPSPVAFSPSQGPPQGIFQPAAQYNRLAPQSSQPAGAPLQYDQGLNFQVNNNQMPAHPNEAMYPHRQHPLPPVQQPSQFSFAHLSPHHRVEQPWQPREADARTNPNSQPFQNGSQPYWQQPMFHQNHVSSYMSRPHQQLPPPMQFDNRLSPSKILPSHHSPTSPFPQHFPPQPQIDARYQYPFQQHQQQQPQHHRPYQQQPQQHYANGHYNHVIDGQSYPANTPPNMPQQWSLDQNMRPHDPPNPTDTQFQDHKTG